MSVGIQVKAVPALSTERGAGGWCDGLSFAAHKTILYATSKSRRENFTLLHEYAHGLIEDDDEAMVWLADRDAPDRTLELLCDTIAGMLLVPEYMVDLVVGNGPVTGQHLLDLFLRTRASQIACAVALSSRLGNTGAVMLTDRTTNKVVYAALVDNPSVYPRKNQPVPTDHPLTRIEIKQNVCRESFWATPSGARHAYYINATAREKRTYSILSEVDLWGCTKVHLNMPGIGNDGQIRVPFTCACGFNGEVPKWPCENCGKYFCPKCYQCDCERRNKLETPCGSCFRNAPRHTLLDGVCSDCR
jgi:hypothetical protein